MVLRILFILFFLNSLHTLSAQERFWIYLEGKEIPKTTAFAPVSGKTVFQRRITGLPEFQESDYPPSADCIKNIQQAGISPFIISKWLNAVSAEITAEQMSALKSCKCVKKIEPIQTFTYPIHISGNEKISAYSYSTALKQMKAEFLSSKELLAENFTIGVIDAGFYEADQSAYLKNIFNEKRIDTARDFLLPEKKDLYSTSESELDDHGTMVLGYISGEIDSKLLGMARKARFVLARTDHGTQENRREEDLWIAAVEWMDSLGIRLINTSLGYGDGFDDAKENYKPSQMDGKTSAIAKAADIAAREKGILIVVGAGNDGERKDWGVISTPADAKGVLTVGANTLMNMKASYSGTGPEKLPWLKPDVSAYSDMGTSFSAPLITGLAACLWEYEPTLSNTQLKEIIIRSAHLYPFGNNYIGNGIPNAEKAFSLIQSPKMPVTVISTIRAEKKKVIIDLKAPAERIVLFHKSSVHKVSEQETFFPQGTQIDIKRPDGFLRTTVAADLNEVYEIIWE